MKPVLTVVFLVALSFSVAAQTKRPVAPAKPVVTPVATPAPSNPAPAPDMSVFGIKLGSPLGLPECTGFKTYDRYEIEKPMLLTEKRCFQFGPFKSMTDETKGVLRWVIFPYTEKIVILKDGAVTVSIIDGNVQGLSFKTDGVDSQALVLETLRQKYGSPTSISTNKVQNRMGATFNQITAVWKFSNLIVAFEGVQTQIDEGLVIIDTPKGWALRNAPTSKGTPM